MQTEQPIATDNGGRPVGQETISLMSLQKDEISALPEQRRCES